MGAILATTVVYFALKSEDKEHEFPKLPGIQLFHAWNFFGRRYDFLQSGFKRTSGKSFTFNALQHNVIALTGEEGRRVFFSSPYLDIREGAKLLTGAVPRIGNVDIATEKCLESTNQFIKKINKLLNSNRLENVLPILLEDIFTKSDTWGKDGKNGRIEPFNDVHHLVTLLAARFAVCEDLTKNEAHLKRIAELFCMLQAGSTPASFLLPWFPSPARRATKGSTTELFTLLYTYVENRRHVEPKGEGIDILIADGESNQIIVECMMGIFSASIIATSTVASWMLVHLAIHQDWKEKCRAEIQDVLSRHLDDSSSSTTLYEKLRAIPFSAWEKEFPTLDACIRESQRIVLASARVRRNIGQEFNICGQIVKRGDFVAYAAGDTHLNPEYFPEPEKYDPGRWLRPDPVPAAAYTFVAWGAGRHPCTGTRLAKLELKLILATFLMRYEYDLVDEGGKFPNPPPVPERNDSTLSRRPLSGAYYFDLKQV